MKKEGLIELRGMASAIVSIGAEMEGLVMTPKLSQIFGGAGRLMTEFCEEIEREIGQSEYCKPFDEERYSETIQQLKMSQGKGSSEEA